MPLRLALPQLTIQGRRRFGEFLANTLLAAGGAIGISVGRLLWAGTMQPSALAFVLGALIVAACAGAAVAVRYFTEERLGEREGSPL